MKNLFFGLLALLLLAISPANAQIRTPAASQGAKLQTTVGLTDVTLEYSRPSVKDRVVFAKDGLVPYGEVWRTGANQATKLTFSDAVTLGGKELKGGSYALLTKPMAEQWEVMVYPYENGNWAGYVEKEPVAKFTVPAQKTGRKVESFTMDVNNIQNDAASIDIMWDNTMVSLPLKVEVDKKVMADIERVMAGPSANDYFAAGSYLHDKGENERALEYIQKANSMGEPRFWMLRREALVLADLGKKKEAMEAAKKSMELAKAAGNMDYVRMNEKSIKEWSM